ncbi:hypothetical protein [Bradyrhizobium arachidis]|uniref:hypothetical protein n=1 Tax=Bradyrhizobium arachidis TaxID=858423 RepID=UPI002161262B|nr:hypothetical protein [Bradyrhizobium arachidis]UVO28154.1 hypothetical protein KUF59_37740 [Bradyrhizobium arachidis]
MGSKPGVALQDVPFEEGPYIVQRGENFYLHYRLAAGADERPRPRMVVDSKKAQDKAFYFFIGPISNPERGNVIERPLASDGLMEFARRGALYWLNPDGSEIPLEIRREAEHRRE